ncbi:unnamed protein product, partial [Didymodactylos carnosus]
IKDYGQIQFAENDRLSKFIRIPFTPKVGHKEGKEDDDKKRENKNKSKKPTEGPRQIEIPKSTTRSETTTLKAEKPSQDQTETLNLNNKVELPTTREDNTTIEENKDEEAIITPQIVQFMKDMWKLQPPQLIISVTGGARLFKWTTPGMLYAFQKGLTSAAVTTDAWIFTGGTKSGIMKEVGDAIDKCRYKNTKTSSKIPCIGISSWGYTIGHEQLEQNREQRRMKQATNEETIDIQKDELDRIRFYRERESYQKEEDGCTLDPNHTHFILLDDGWEYPSHKVTNDKCIKCDECICWAQHYNAKFRSDLILSLRAAIEKEAREDREHNYTVPIVQILANGGPSTILTVVEALKRETPVIIIDGTGRAAEEIKKQYCEECNKTMKKAKNENKLDEAILQALVNATEMKKNENSNEHKIKELELAMTWKQFDLAQKQILTQNNVSKWTENQLADALWNALRLDSVQFVGLLIEWGASFDHLRKIIDIRDIIQKEIDKREEKKNVKLITDLLGFMFQNRQENETGQGILKLINFILHFIIK